MRLGKTNGVSSQRRFSVRADKQKENEKLREALSRKAASLEHLQGELAAVQAEKERLQREVDGKERENQRLLQEACHGRRALSRWGQGPLPGDGCSKHTTHGMAGGNEMRGGSHLSQGTGPGGQVALFHPGSIKASLCKGAVEQPLEAVSAYTLWSLWKILLFGKDEGPGRGVLGLCRAEQGALLEEGLGWKRALGPGRTLAFMLSDWEATGDSAHRVDMRLTRTLSRSC